MKTIKHFDRAVLLTTLIAFGVVVIYLIIKY